MAVFEPSPVADDEGSRIPLKNPNTHARFNHKYNYVTLDIYYRFSQYVTMADSCSKRNEALWLFME